RRRHTRFSRDWSSDVCSSDLHVLQVDVPAAVGHIVRVADSAPETGSASANLTGLGHRTEISSRTKFHHSKLDFPPATTGTLRKRSEERRVGERYRAGEPDSNE